MIAPSDLDHVASAPFDRTLCREMERWFVDEYIPTWVEAGTAASADLRSILDYWGVPLHVSNPNGNQWLTTPGEVVEMLEAIQKPLKARGYSHTVIIDRRSTYYNERAISGSPGNDDRSSMASILAAALAFARSFWVFWIFASRFARFCCFFANGSST